MNNDIERNLGKQPIATVMEEQNIKPRDIVAASTEQITHKMVTRASKGRRLTTRVQLKILNALNKASNNKYTINDLFNY